MAVYSIPPVGPGWELAALIARYRFSLGLEREVIAILERAYREIAEEIARGPQLTRLQRRPIEDRFLQVRALLSEAYGTARSSVSPTLREYLALEMEIAGRHAEALRAVGAAYASPSIASSVGGGIDVLVSAVPRQLVVSAARLPEIVASIDVGGIGFGEWWDKAREDGILRVRRLIQTGVIRGQNPAQIASTIWQSRNTGGANAWRQSRTVLQTAIRTVTTSLQTEATLASQTAFHDVISGYRYEAVLDARTSSICRSLDNTEWKVGDPKMPVPPQHPNCRSALVPILAIPGLKSPSTSPRQTYDAWLREQPATVQNHILGKGVAEHWRRGQASISDLLSVDRRPLTLAQLRTVLSATEPASYRAWIQSLPASAQDAVLGVSLARQLRAGTASIEDVLAASARRGIVRPAP